MDDNQITPEKLPDGLQDPQEAEAVAGDGAAALDPSVVDSLPTEDLREDALTVDSDASELHAPAFQYPIVAVGASAGGLQAFRDMLDQISPKTGLTFAYISHLAPHHDTQIVELLQRHTTMPVLPIEEGQRPLPDHVYVLLPNHYVTLQGGRFRLKERTQKDISPATINRFFRSVAEDQKNYCVGVVLSGADGDGAEGLKAIKGEGGFALVQSPDSAVQPGMPRSSIAADHVDIVLPPPALAAELERIAQQFTKPELGLLEQGKTPEAEEASFQRILQLLRNQSGLEVRQYKPQTVRRRMARRMVLLRMETLTEYHRFLQGRSDEIRALQEDILINVTRFFRDPPFWEAIQAHVLPALFQDRAASRPVRIWCAGCSTGEEAYSLAITVLEYITSNSLDTTVQIFGTDASERSIEKARTAVYPDTIAADMEPERLRRHFIRVDNGYQVSKRVRDVCIFARQNLCNDPPFSHMDIVSCRNVMIYFNQVLQRHIMSTFHYALEGGGYMLLGMSEGLREYGDAFFAVDRKHKIYSKAGGGPPLEFPPPRDYRQSPANAGGQPAPYDRNGLWREADLQRAADRIVLARFGPPALVVDDRMNVLQSRGQTSPLIQLASGTVSWNLSRVLRLDIANEVREAVQRSIQENIAVTIALQTFDDEKGSQPLQVDVLPIANVGPTPRCYLILFQLDAGAAAKPAAGLPAATAELNHDEKDRLLLQLRQDLNASRFHLQTVLEERDTRNQELVSASEEVQSANEELQSTNEELQQRNGALEQTGNDLRNLLHSVNIPLLMLTGEFHIRQFTPPIQKLISVLPSDIGRPISDIRNHLKIDNLESLLEEVSETLIMHESEVQATDGRWYLLRIRPYRTSDNKIEGLVVVLVDINQLRSSQQASLEARDFSRSLVESVPIPVVVLNHLCNIEVVNSAFRELTAMHQAELTGRSLPDLVHHLWGMEGLGERLGDLLVARQGSSFTLEHKSTTTDQKILLVRGLCLTTEGSPVLLLVMEDITLRRHAEQLLNHQNQSLTTDVQNAAVELDRTHTELWALTAHLFTVQEEERQRIARELHDDVSQRLSLLDLILGGISSTDPAAEAGEKIEEARKSLQSLSTDVRTMSHQLHPAVLDDLGLGAALKALVTEFGKREGMPATYVGRNLPDLPPQPATTAIYRITQEALRNVAKHAGTTHVKVILERRDGHLHLEVRDLGVGFDTDGNSEMSGPGLGMITMRERARLAYGTVSVQSALGEGTTVLADIPYREDA